MLETSNLLTTDTLELKRRYSGMHGNSINYLATLIEGLQRGNEEGARQEAAQNMFTAIVEHPLMHATGRYTYSLDWNYADGYAAALNQALLSDSDSDWQALSQYIRLRTEFGDLDSIYEESVANASGQIPEFELDRNRQDLEFYKKLKIARARGYNGPMVMFSPSPEMTAAAYARGYKGNDYVAVYDNIAGREQITQFWFAGQDITEYRRLLANDQLQSTIDVMQSSGAFNPNLFEKIEKFITIKRYNIQAAAETLTAYAYSDIAPKVTGQLLELLSELADLTSNGTDISSGLKQLFERMASLQFELILKIQELSKKASPITAEVFASLDHKAQTGILEDIEFIMEGCGFSGGFKSSEQYRSIQSNIWGSSGAVLESVNGVPARVQCKNRTCTNSWIVINGDSSTYQKSCSACGEDMTC